MADSNLTGNQLSVQSITPDTLRKILIGILDRLDAVEQSQEQLRLRVGDVESSVDTLEHDGEQAR